MRAGPRRWRGRDRSENCAVWLCAGFMGVGVVREKGLKRSFQIELHEHYINLD